MKPYLAFPLLFVFVFAGCLSEEPTTLDTNAQAPAQSKPNGAANAPGSLGSPSGEEPPESNPSPPPPKQAYRGSLGYALDSDVSGTFDVEERVAKLVITVYLNVTDNGVYLLQKEELAVNPAVTFTPPGSEDTSSGETTPNLDSVRISFQTQANIDGTPGKRLEGPLERTVENPVKGTWAISLTGLGENVQVDILVMQHFKPPPPEQ